jgi:hypothetical protein
MINTDKIIKVFTVAICINISAAVELIEDISVSNPDKSLLRKIVIERIYDREILNNSSKYIELLSDQKWSCSSIRIYIANVLIEKSDLTTKQALDINTVLYRECVPYDSGAISSLLRQLLLCLPEGGDTEMIYKAIVAAGWNIPGTNMPLSFEFFTQYKNYIDKSRNSYIGRGPPAIAYEFPFNRIVLRKLNLRLINKGD